MKKWKIMVFVCFMVCLSANATPNVIIIYSDDHGYTDLGAHGIDSNLQTPHMDALARGGALMTAGYSSAPQCRPSRCGLMAGRIQNEFGFSQNHSDTGEGEGTLPRTYPAGTDMAGKPLLTIADRMKKLGYVTGFSGKWHCGTNDDKDGKYDPRGRGFDEYWVGPKGNFSANFNLDGKSIPHQKIKDPRNRVIVQGKACEAFIERNRKKKFFLYFPIFGPHVPLIDKDDPYYLNFPKQDYPQWNDAQDDVRRQGLALLKAMDDAIGGVVNKLRELGLEENTLILFAGDNGAPDNNGSSNVPMRGKKGHLHEGGIRVPMFAYWKGKILPGQEIEEMVTTLDFTATTLAAGGGKIPPEFDGVNILPRLTGKVPEIARTQPMFWDFYTGQAIREGDWKLWRNGEETLLFHIAEDPSELVNLAYQQPERLAEMTKKLDEWTSTLRPDATYATSGRQISVGNELQGAPEHVQPDPRYLVPYDNPKPTPYPLPVASPGKPEGVKAPVVARPSSPTRYDFTTDGDFEGWDGKIKFIENAAVANGFLSGRAESGQGKFDNQNINLDGSKYKRMVVRIKSDGSANILTIRWNIAGDEKLNNKRMVRVPYTAKDWTEVAIDLSGNKEWIGKTITKIRLQPSKKPAAFEIDWIRFE